MRKVNCRLEEFKDISHSRKPRLGAVSRGERKSNQWGKQLAKEKKHFVDFFAVFTFLHPTDSPWVSEDNKPDRR